MYLRPAKRHFLLEPNVSETVSTPQTEGVLVPPNEKRTKKTNKFEFYKVVDVAIDCELKIAKGKVVLVDNSMVEEVVSPDGVKYLFILENHIRGFFLDGER